MINEFYKEKPILKKKEEIEELRKKYLKIISEWIIDCKREWITHLEISYQLHLDGINMPPSRISDIVCHKDNIWIENLQKIIDFIFNKKEKWIEKS